MPTEAKLQNKGKKSFFKTDFAKMGGTALVTSLIFLAVIFSSEIAALIKPPMKEYFANDTISVYKMETLRKQYIEGTPIKKLNVNGNKVDTLQGFVFSKTALKNILLHNEVKGSLGFSKKADAIVFYLGQEGTFPDDINPTINRPIYNLIALGAVNDGDSLKLILPAPADYNNANKSSIYDKAKPCPGMGCPPPPPQ